VTYALAHPDYLKDHPELQEGYNIISGATLPASVKSQLSGYHPNWGDGSDGSAGMQKNSGLWSKWETWLQLALGAGVAYEVAPALMAAGAPAAAPAAATGTTAATGAGTGATAAGTGAAAGGTGAATAGTGASYIGSDIAGTAATSGGAAAMAPTTITGLTTPGVGAAATTPAFAAGGSTGAAAAPSIWDRIFGKSTTDKIITGAGMGANLAGSIIQSRQASKAAEAEKEAADKALALQSNIYQQQRSDLAPYRNAGASSLSALTYGLGLDPSKSADTTTPYFAQQAQGQNTAAQQTSQAQNRMPPAAPSQAMPRTSLSAISAPAANGFVNMVSPDGRPARVPQNQVQAAMAAGGRLA
jgi:hypothetical protein